MGFNGPCRIGFRLLLGSSKIAYLVPSAHHATLQPKCPTTGAQDVPSPNPPGCRRAATLQRPRLPSGVPTPSLAVYSRGGALFRQPADTAAQGTAATSADQFRSSYFKILDRECFKISCGRELTILYCCAGFFFWYEFEYPL